METQSIRALSQPGDPPSSETAPTGNIARREPNNVCPKDESSRRATIDVLPDDVLLEIFDFYRDNCNDVWKWRVLVHVCQKWRHVAFASPQRLKLKLMCTPRTPVRKYLGIWPAYPIALSYTDYYRHPNEEDNVIAALEHPNRVCSITFFITCLQFGKVVTLMQVPFPLLTSLCIELKDGNPPVFPAEFLGGSAPCLQKIVLFGIPFPALPRLLLSTSDLITLTLQSIPPTSYISPETMGACLATLPQLKRFTIEFQTDTSHPHQIRPPPVTRTVLPSLTYFSFQGANKYLEDLVSHMDGPQLNWVSITYLNQPVDFQAPQLSKFIERSVGPELSRPRHAYVCFDVSFVSFAFYRHGNTPGRDRAFTSRWTISSDAFDLQVYDVANALSQFSVSLFTVVYLELDTDLEDTSRLEDTHDIEWLYLFRQFPALQMLYVSWSLAGLVAIALNDTTGETVTEALPFLDLICLEAQRVETLAHRLSDRPVTVVGRRGEFNKRLNSYFSK